MKRTALALMLIPALLFSVATGTQMANLAEANPFPPVGPSVNVIIQSPQNRAYNTRSILLNFSAKTSYELGASLSFFYLLDGQDYRYDSVRVEEIQDLGSDAEYRYGGEVIFSNLSDGAHTVTVFLGYVDSGGSTQIQQIDMNPSSARVNFSIKLEPFPSALVIASMASVVIISLGVLVCFRKHHSIG